MHNPDLCMTIIDFDRRDVGMSRQIGNAPPPLPNLQQGFNHRFANASWILFAAVPLLTQDLLASHGQLLN